jgi:methylmalonyl-CoA/ethylmalonyl-CoA epimerase
VKFDHVAIAAPDHRPVLRSLTGELGALILSGGTPRHAGFRAVQVRIGRGTAGMTIEVLEPFEPQHNDFLARFVDATGGGVHHITFKTDDVAAERERLQGVGIEPVGVNFEGDWKEMFIHPRDGHGTVIQIAQSSFPSPPIDEWLDSLPEGLTIFDGDGPWWDPASVLQSDTPATLLRAVIASPDISAGRAFYRDVLGGVADGDTITWDGGEILLEASDSRPRVDRLEIDGHPGLTTAGVRFVGR